MAKKGVFHFFLSLSLFNYLLTFIKNESKIHLKNDGGKFFCQFGPLVETTRQMHLTSVVFFVF